MTQRLVSHGYSSDCHPFRRVPATDAAADRNANSSKALQTWRSPRPRSMLRALLSQPQLQATRELVQGDLKEHLHHPQVQQYNHISVN